MNKQEYSLKLVELLEQATQTIANADQTKLIDFPAAYRSYLRDEDNYELDSSVVAVANIETEGEESFEEELILELDEGVKLPPAPSVTEESLLHSFHLFLNVNSDFDISFSESKRLVEVLKKEDKDWYRNYVVMFIVDVTMLKLRSIKDEFRKISKAYGSDIQIDPSIIFNSFTSDAYYTSSRC